MELISNEVVLHGPPPLLKKGLKHKVQVLIISQLLEILDVLFLSPCHFLCGQLLINDPKLVVWIISVSFRGNLQIFLIVVFISTLIIWGFSYRLSLVISCATKAEFFQWFFIQWLH